MRQKVSTIATLWASIGFSMWLVAGGFWLNLLMFVIASGVTLHLVLLRTYRPEAELKAEQDKLTSFEIVP